MSMVQEAISGLCMSDLWKLLNYGEERQKTFTNLNRQLRCFVRDRIPDEVLSRSSSETWNAVSDLMKDFLKEKNVGRKFWPDPMLEDYNGLSYADDPEKIIGHLADISIQIKTDQQQTTKREKGKSDVRSNSKQSGEHATPEAPSGPPQTPRISSVSSEQRSRTSPEYATAAFAPPASSSNSAQPSSSVSSVQARVPQASSGASASSGVNIGPETSSASVVTAQPLPATKHTPQAQQHPLTESASTAAKNKRRRAQGTESSSKRLRPATLAVDATKGAAAVEHPADMALVSNMVSGSRAIRQRDFPERATTSAVEEAIGAIDTTTIPFDPDRSGTYRGAYSRRNLKRPTASAPGPSRSVGAAATGGTVADAATTHSSRTVNNPTATDHAPGLQDQRATATFNAPVAVMKPQQEATTDGSSRKAASGAQPSIKRTYWLYHREPLSGEHYLVQWHCKGGMQNMSFSQLKEETLSELAPGTKGLRLTLQVAGCNMSMNVPLDREEEYTAWKSECQHIVERYLSRMEQGQDLPLKILIQAATPEREVRQPMEPEGSNVW